MTTQAGFVDPDGRGLGVVAADLDDDNKIDLYVANDMSANYLFHNLGGFRFEETGQIAGAAASADGLYKSGMGIACGDLDGDGCARPGRDQLLRRVDDLLSEPRPGSFRRPYRADRPPGAEPSAAGVRHRPFRT